MIDQVFCPPRSANQDLMACTASITVAINDRTSPMQAAVPDTPLTLTTCSHCHVDSR